MTAELMTLQVRSRRQWRAWLAKHHTSSPGVWLVFYVTPAGLAAAPIKKTYAPKPAIPELPASIAKALKPNSKA